MDATEGFMLRKLARVRCVHTRANMKEDGGKERLVVEEEEEDDEPVSPMARLFHEPECNLCIIAIMGSKTLIDPIVVMANLEHTLLRHPRFSSLQVFDENKDGGEMKWTRTIVDVEEHVIIPNLDTTTAKMDPPAAQKWVEDYISNLSNTTIDPSKPLWDLHLLNLRTAADTAATAVFRVHHSLGDGVSLMSLLLACMRKVSDPEALPTLPAKGKNVEKTRRNCYGLKGIWSMVRLYWNTFVDLVLFVATALFLKDTDTPLRGSGRSENCRRRFVVRTVSLEDVKLVKSSMGATVNDVVLGVIQAALSRYLNQRYGEEGRDMGSTQWKNNLPKKIRCRAPLFINLRPSPGIPALADMMSKGSAANWGNRIGYVLLPLTIALRDDPLDYICEAKATVDRKKHSLEALCTLPIADFIIQFFGIKAGSVLTYRVPSYTTICFSNMVGPQEEIGFFGHPMSYLAPSCYGQPNALMIHVQSYVDKMTFVLSVDETIIPDPYRLCDDLEESLKLIKDAVLART